LVFIEELQIGKRSDMDMDDDVDNAEIYYVIASRQIRR
jgi:hypothetical protein